MDLMENSIKQLIKGFESKSKGKDRYKDFVFYCYNCLNQSKGSKKKINKYDSMRKDLIKYLIANEKLITAELSK